MIKIILTSFSFLLTITLFGQNKKIENNSVLKYDLLTNNTDFSYFGAGLNYDITLNRAMLSVVSFGLNGKYFNKYIEINVDSRMHFSDGMDFIGEQTEIHSIESYSKPKDASLKFTYYFKNNIKEKTKAIYVGSDDKYSYNMKIPMNVNNRMGIDVSIEKGEHYFYFDHFDDYRFLDGTFHNDWRESSTVHRFITIGYGINFTNVQRISVDTERFGKSSMAELRKLSLKMNFLVVSSLDNVIAKFDYYGPNNEPSSYGAEPLFQYRRELSVDHISRSIIGLSIIYEEYTFIGFSNFGTSIELGVKPGVKYHFYDLLFVDFKMKLNLGHILN